MDKHNYFPFIGTRKLFLKPASFASAKNEQNGSSSENGSASSPSVNNPFLKCEKEEPEGTKNEEKSDEHEKDPAGKQTTNNLFKPTKTNLFANAASSALSDNSNFVFGQNLHERVVMVRRSIEVISSGMNANVCLVVHFRKTSARRLIRMRIPPRTITTISLLVP